MRSTVMCFNTVRFSSHGSLIFRRRSVSLCTVVKLRSITVRRLTLRDAGNGYMFKHNGA